MTTWSSHLPTAGQDPFDVTMASAIDFFQSDVAASIAAAVAASGTGITLAKAQGLQLVAVPICVGPGQVGNVALPSGLPIFYSTKLVGVAAFSNIAAGPTGSDFIIGINSGSGTGSGGNVMSAAAASFEDGTTGGWNSVTNAGVANDSTYAADGSKSLMLTSSASGGDYSAVSGFFPVTAGQPGIGLASIRQSVARNVITSLYCYKADGVTQTGVINGTSTAGSTSAFVATNSGTSNTIPALTTQARLYVDVLSPAAAGEKTWIDKASISNSSSTTWAAGGTGGTGGAASITTCTIPAGTTNSPSWPTMLSTPYSLTGGSSVLSFTINQIGSTAAGSDVVLWLLMSA